jgi:hypothetical protein
VIPSSTDGRNYLSRFGARTQERSGGTEPDFETGTVSAPSLPVVVGTDGSAASDERAPPLDPALDRVDLLPVRQ